MQGILNVRLSEGDVHRTCCPSVGCSCRLPFTDAQQLLSKAQKVRYEQLLAQNYADTNPAIKWCALCSPVRRKQMLHLRSLKLT